MASGQQPLSELSPGEQRRNSSGWSKNNQELTSDDSSPFESSPSHAPTSPRMKFWQERDPASPYRLNLENKYPLEAAVSRSKRSSIENLKRASRVKNSKMLAREHTEEYDPAQVRLLERPLANGRPLSQRSQRIPRDSIDARRQLPSQTTPSKTKSREASQTDSTPRSLQNSDSLNYGCPTRSQGSPPKSSLSKAGRFSGRSPFDPQSEIWSDGEDSVDKSFRSSHRHTKSVTFDAAPPQVNEYEMTTPVPSSIASSSREGSYDSEEHEESFDFECSVDRDDSFDASLEDTDKTPVMLPDEWRFMSVDSGNDSMSQDEYDPFGEEDYGSPGPDIRPSSPNGSSSFRSRIESLDSNGERRPLPPLPPSHTQKSPRHSFSSTLERASTVSRPAPLRPSSYSKDDINGIGTGSFTLEDRLRLMMTQDNEPYYPDAETQRERKMRRAGVKDRNKNEREDTGNPDDSVVSESGLSHDEYSTPPLISRESILQNLAREDAEPEEESMISSVRSPSPLRPLPLDPDIPIPSLEDGDTIGDDDVSVKEEEHEIDLYAIPEFSGLHVNDADEANAEGNNDDDDESHYSQASFENEQDPTGNESDNAERELTPVPTQQAHTEEPTRNDTPSSRPSTADGDHQLDLDMYSYVDRSTPSFQGSPEAPAPLDISAIRESLHPTEAPEQVKFEEPAAENGDDIGRPHTPDSVIRHSSPEGSPEAVPEPIATVKASGAGLRTRPSLTPADSESMAAIRRKVSGQESRVSSIPEQDLSAMSGQIRGHTSESESGSVDSAETAIMTGAPTSEKRQVSLVKLDIPVSTSDEGLGFGLDEEFDRVIEAQKRGYLMRQNTKVIVASSNPRDEPSPTETSSGAPKPVTTSPRKASQLTWTTEPWNGKSRRQSIKVGGNNMARKKADPVPPLPGHESNVKEGVEEPETAADDVDDGNDRGRLFVKVVGVKDLDLPLPRGERSFFSLTLDNGLHCVTTSWLELGKSAPIGQEFELVVLNELEFQLTLQMKIDPPKPKPQLSRAASPPKAQKPQKTSTFSRVFASPKKRREMELRQQMEAQQLKQKEENSLTNPDPWDKLRNVVAKDGSFGRAYVSLADHEQDAFGRPVVVDIACFNEWAVDEVKNNSKTKRTAPAGSGVQRRPPYMIGQLELQLLYVPKPKGATDDDMPKSMNACIREMREADNTAMRSWEGFLSQQGGDCPYWRRRYFKLQASKLTAYHETTRQPRATINLAKASKLIDDRSVLTQKETSTKGGKRRKSAFAEEEEGYMFVEEGFRIRFGNGEVIDFYADSRAEKEGWLKVLSETVGKGYAAGSGQAKAWTELVLRREKSLRSRMAATEARPLTAGNLGSRPPQVPNKDIVPTNLNRPMAPPPKPRHQHTHSQPTAGRDDARRQKTRSLIF